MSTPVNNNNNVDPNTPPNIGEISDAPYSFRIIRLGFTIVAALSGTVVILSAVNGFRTIDPTVLTLASSVVSGIFGFLAGRKK